MTFKPGLSLSLNVLKINKVLIKKNRVYLHAVVRYQRVTAFGLERKPGKRDCNKYHQKISLDLAMFGDVTTSDRTRPVSHMTRVMED